MLKEFTAPIQAFTLVQAAHARLHEVNARYANLEEAFIQAEARHAIDSEVLRASLRRAEQLLQEQYDHGFVAGLKYSAIYSFSDNTPFVRMYAKERHARNMWRGISKRFRMIVADVRLRL